MRFPRNVLLREYFRENPPNQAPIKKCNQKSDGQQAVVFSDYPAKKQEGGQPVNHTACPDMVRLPAPEPDPNPGHKIDKKKCFPCYRPVKIKQH